METANEIVKKSAVMNDEFLMLELINSEFDPNFEGGWPLRLAARHGSYAVVRTLIEHGANPHLLGETGASALQLAVFSGLHWNTDKWLFLLSCYDSSQLADGAAVAIVFKNTPALEKIIQTGRCNTNIPTTLTGKTLEQLAKGYKLQHLLAMVPSNLNDRNENFAFPNNLRRSTNSAVMSHLRSPIPSTSSSDNLSPSVARFFHQASAQTALTPPRYAEPNGSPYSIQ